MDRNYYRLCDDADLIRRALEGTDELAIVLAERLDTATEEQEAFRGNEVAEYKREIEELETLVEDLEDEAYNLRCQIEAMENSK